MFKKDGFVYVGLDGSEILVPGQVKKKKMMSYDLVKDKFCQCSITNYIYYCGSEYYALAFFPDRWLMNRS